MNEADSKLSDSEFNRLFRSSAYDQVLDLYSNDLLLKSGESTLKVQFQELRIFDPVSSGFSRLFNQFKRFEGQLFVPVRRGFPQPNVIVNPDPTYPSVNQICKVIVGGIRKSFGSLLKDHFSGINFDGYDLFGADENSKLSLVPAPTTPSLSITKDTRGKALAVVSRG